MNAIERCARSGPKKLTKTYITKESNGFHHSTFNNYDQRSK